MAQRSIRIDERRVKAAEELLAGPDGRASALRAVQAANGENSFERSGVRLLSRFW